MSKVQQSNFNSPVGVGVVGMPVMINLIGFLDKVVCLLFHSNGNYISMIRSASNSVLTSVVRSATQ